MTEVLLNLTDLNAGETATIDQISLPADDQQFLMRMGFVPGTEVQFCRRAPLGDPMVFMIDGAQIALRSETAAHILVCRSIPSNEVSR